MNSFELNKILGAILGTCLITLALNIGAGAIFAPEKPAKPGYAIAVKEQGEGEKAGAAKEPEQPIETLLAKASVEKGQATAKQCQACHTFEKGGPNRVGPNLWNIVEPRAARSEAGFNYLGGDEGQGRQMELRGAQQVPGQSARLYPGHGHDLRRAVARPAARRRDRFPAHAVGQPGAAAEGGGSMPPAGGAKQSRSAIHIRATAGPTPGRLHRDGCLRRLATEN